MFGNNLYPQNQNPARVEALSEALLLPYNDHETHPIHPSKHLLSPYRRDSRR